MNKGSSPRNYPVFVRLADESFHNASHLLFDAMVLYRSNSWPSACSLAILSLEEIGKFFIIHHISGESVQFEEKRKREEFLDRIFAGGMVYKHRLKQEWALVDGGIKITRLLDPIYLDRLKQRGFYVGFEKGRIKSPSSVTRASAFRMIKTSVEVFRELIDFEFEGWLESAATDLNHKEYIRGILAEFGTINETNANRVPGSD